MEFQEILALIQTGIGLVSLGVSLMTLNKINKIKVNNSNNKQTAIGKRNKQRIK